MTAQDSNWDPDATKHSIVQAAENLFIENGFEGTSMASIAREAGVTKSLIHHHYGCKKELWSVVKMRRYAEYEAVQQQVFETLSSTVDMEKALSETIDAYFNFAKNNQEMMRLLAWMAIEGAPTVEQITDEIGERHLALEALEAAQAEGRLREDIDVRFLLMTLIGSIQHWFQMCPVWKAKGLVKAEREDEDAIFLSNLKKITLEGILPFDD